MEAVAAFPGATFLSTGGYHHQVGANEWESRGGSPAPAGSTRLLSVHARLGDGDAVAALRSRLGLDEQSDGAGFEVSDPSGNLWRLRDHEP